MIRFAPKIQQDVAPAMKIAKSNVNTRSDIELSDISIAAAESETDRMEGQAATTISGPAEPAAKLLELSGDLSPKGRKTGSRKRKEVTSPKQPEVGSRSRDQSVGDLLLDL